jgi:3,4-dihydroxy-2-butanone 4-phosphate synthase
MGERVPLNEEKVTLMIKHEIECYDLKQDVRHRENSSRLEAIIAEQKHVSHVLAAASGEAKGRAAHTRIFLAVAAAAGSAVMAVVVELIKHGMGLH